MTVADAKMPGGSVDTARLHFEYAQVLVKLEKYKEAEPHLVQVHVTYLAAMGKENRLTVLVARALADMYEKWGNAEKAGEWRERSGK